VVIARKVVPSVLRLCIFDQPHCLRAIDTNDVLQAAIDSLADGAPQCKTFPCPRNARSDTGELMRMKGTEQNAQFLQAGAIAPSISSSARFGLVSNYNLWIVPYGSKKRAAADLR